jgi:hypothetical protein
MLASFLYTARRFLGGTGDFACHHRLVASALVAAPLRGAGNFACSRLLGGAFGRGDAAFGSLKIVAARRQTNLY